MATGQSRAEQRVILHDVGWETYECLLRDLESSSAPRLTYDRGTLEIMSPLPDHERYNSAMASVVDIAAMEWGFDIDKLGSTTFRRADLERGFEPDSCFYIQNAEKIRGKKRINLRVDPPPDLVIEIDITHSSLDKLRLYAALGIPEVWRYNGRLARIHGLESDGYHELEASTVIPGLSAADLTSLLEESKTQKRTDWLRRVQDWARQHPRAGGA